MSATSERCVQLTWISVWLELVGRHGTVAGHSGGTCVPGTVIAVCMAYRLLWHLKGFLTFYRDDDDDEDHNNSIHFYLRANLTARRPITKYARETTKILQ
jgi:hypothetical protein